MVNYKPYPEYKPSGVEWIGDVPKGWEVKKLKYLGKSIIGLTYSPGDVTTNGNGTLVLRSSNIKKGAIDYDDCVYVGKNIPHKLITQKGDILICSRSGSVKLVGKSALIDDHSSGQTFGAFMTVFRSKYYKYLIFFISSDVFKSQSGLFATTTINQLTNSILSNIKVPLPVDIQNQNIIAAYLIKKTSQIDDLIQKKEKMIKLLKEKRAVLINQAVTKGLNPNAKMKPSGIDWIGDIPEGWEVKKLAYISDIVLGKMLTPNDKGAYWLKYYLRAKNLGWFKVNIEDVKEMWFSNSELNIYRLQKDDLLVSEGGEVGRTCIWNDQIDECYTQNSVHRVRVNKGMVAKYYLYQFYALGYMGYFESIVNRISIGHLTKEKLSCIKLLVPPSKEQTIIVEFLDKKINEIDGLLQKIESAITKLREYRSSIITAAVTGKIDVREVS